MNLFVLKNLVLIDLVVLALFCAFFLLLILLFIWLLQIFESNYNIAALYLKI